MRQAAFIIVLALGTAAGAQQPNPRQQPGAREVFLHFFGMEITWK